MSIYASARTKAKRRKSPWNILLIPAVFLPFILLSLGAFIAILRIHDAAMPNEASTGRPTIASVISLGALLVAALPLAMIVGNFMIRLVPPARAALDAESVGVPGTSYAAAQRQLFRFCRLIVPVLVLVAIACAFLPWRQ